MTGLTRLTRLTGMARLPRSNRGTLQRLSGTRSLTGSRLRKARCHRRLLRRVGLTRKCRLHPGTYRAHLRSRNRAGGTCRLRIGIRAAPLSSAGTDPRPRSRTGRPRRGRTRTRRTRNRPRRPRRGRSRTRSRTRNGTQRCLSGDHTRSRRWDGRPGSGDLADRDGGDQAFRDRHSGVLGDDCLGTADHDFFHAGDGGAGLDRGAGFAEHRDHAGHGARRIHRAHRGSRGWHFQGRATRIRQHLTGPGCLCTQARERWRLRFARVLTQLCSASL